MKKLLLSVFALTSLGAFAQTPTLTTANQPSISTLQSYFVADSNAANLDGTTGANVTWDYSTLTGYSDAAINQIIDPATTAQASDFTTSTLADETQGNLTLFESIVGSDLMSQGYFFSEATLGDVTAKFSIDEMKVMEYPFTFGDSFTDALSGNVDVQGNAIPYSGTITVTADGYGTLNVGTNSYTDVLRIKTTESSVAQTGVFGDIPVDRVQYYYYQPAVSNFPKFMHVTIDAGGSATTVVYSTDNLVPTNTNEITNEVSLSLFPNPASTELNLNISSVANHISKVNIENILGQVVVNKTVELFKGTNKSKIDVSNLRNGIYLVNVISGNSKVTKKVVIK